MSHNHRGLGGLSGGNRPLRGLVVSTLVASLLSACGHRQDLLQPVKAPLHQTQTVDMLVATTRRPVKDPALRFSGERGDDVSLDNIVVSIPPDAKRKAGTIQWPTSGTPDPQKSFATLKAEKLSEQGAHAWFKRTSGRKRRALVFVHGFNNTYTDSVYRFAQIAHDIRADAAAVLFTWPSRGNALDYVYDRESTIYSRFGLLSVLQEAIRSPDVDEVTILAHSMGTWLTMEALRDIALQNGFVPSKINNVVLASPDIDVDVFRRQVIEMGEKRPKFTIFASRNDLALALSAFIAGDISRLGGADFGQRAQLLASYGIAVIDASDAKQLDPLGHTAFAESSDMLTALSTRLADHQLDSVAVPIGAELQGLARLH